jgi:hypothetical protein
MSSALGGMENNAPARWNARGRSLKGETATMGKVANRGVQRTALTLLADDGTTAVVRRDDGIRLLGLPTRLRMYRVHLEAQDDHKTVTVSRPLLKQLLRGGARITGRVA